MLKCLFRYPKQDLHKTSEDSCYLRTLVAWQPDCSAAELLVHIEPIPPRNQVRYVQRIGQNGVHFASRLTDRIFDMIDRVWRAVREDEIRERPGYVVHRGPVDVAVHIGHNVQRL